MILRLYTLAWRLLLLPAWAWWAWRTRRDVGTAERGRWRERLAWAAVPRAAQDGLLLHAASIGEGVAAVALLKVLQGLRPELPLLVTCTSFTGAQRLRQALGDRVHHAFLPFDTPGAMARLLDQARPRAIVLMETELWPNLLAAARARAIPVVLANARLSAASARAYARLAPLSRPMLEGLHAVLAQSRGIARRFQALGVPASRITVTGNLKSDVEVPAAARAQARAWREALGSRCVLVAGSTHPGEDEALLAAWPAVRALRPSALLVLVPRHPQRFDAVALRIGEAGHTLRRRSRGDLPTPDDAVWLGDTLGEMLAWFALADLAFIGGSLVPHGGHNPLEAMALGCPISSGRHVHNFAEAYRALDRADALCWLQGLEPAALAPPLAQLFGDASARRRLGESGRRVFDAGTGAAERSAQQIVALLDQAPGSVTRSEDGACALWCDTAVQPPLPADAFSPSAWRARGAWRATPGGRGSAGFVDHGPNGLVLRHYRRGGLLSRVWHDTYVGRRAVNSRAMREFALLQRLRSAGLAVPRPVAARMQRVGAMRYRADILVERLPGTRSLAELLIEGRRPDADQWRRIGQAIACLHAAAVDHVDLNAHNLLIGADGQVWLIDFDRCRVRSGQGWKAANLARLLRSLRKLRRLHPGFAFDEADWPLLLAAYHDRPGSG